MTSAIAIARKELRGHFNSAAGYVFLTAFLLLTSWFFFRSFFLAGQATLRPFFSMMPWVFLLFVPAAAMRSWAEER
ncbi:MAG: ABC transporter, partial [Chloroflexi bacterium]|nr:ABC transporter [Chloroflexota bacterium]